MTAPRDRCCIRRTIASAACLLLLAGALPAQQAGLRAGPDHWTMALRIADSLAIDGDTAGAIVLLDAQLARNPKDAGAWFRRGMLAWGMTRADRKPGFMKDGGDIRRLMLADSALRLATAYAPDSARFWVGLGRFYLNSNVSSMRFAAQGFMDRGLQAARRVRDKAALAEAADEKGMVHWRRYETVASRRMLRAGFPPSDLAEYAARDPRDLEQLVNEFTQVLKPPLGDNDYETALAFFNEAAAADPNHRNALRHIFMALAARESWAELRSAAARRLRESPWDPQAWLAAGLAAHRLNDDQAATAAFDSALVFLTAEDRDRYTRISRILRPRPADPKSKLIGDSSRYVALSPEQRSAVDKLYWMLTDPLSLTPQNEHRLEFLSRVTYAELRWTSDDLDLKGADTDRGDIHIRYGPPPVLLGLAGGGDAFSNSQMWMYGRGLSFVFSAAPTFGTARFSGDYADVARRVIAAEPVRWDNLPINKTLDSIPVFIARFRAGADSTDVFLSADVPVTKLAKGLDVTRKPVDVDFKFFDAAAETAVHDSTRVVVSDGVDPVQLRAWRNRVGPGTNVYRVEALQPDALVGARAMGSVTSGRESGFGLSDVLLAERVSPRGSAERWSDFAIRPSAGSFRRGQTIDLLWETYDLRAADGGSKYRVAIIFEPQGKTGFSGVAARVVGGMSDVVGRTASSDRGRITLRYDRAAAARPTVVDYVTLDLTSARPGRYNLTIEVTDLVANTRTSRRTSLNIVP